MTCLYCGRATRVVETKRYADWAQEERLCSCCGKRTYWAVTEGSRRLVSFAQRKPETFRGVYTMADRCEYLAGTKAQKAPRTRWIPPKRAESTQKEV